MSAGCMVWLGFLFFPFWILAALLVLVSPFALLLPKVNQCQDCKYTWKVNKKLIIPNQFATSIEQNVKDEKIKLELNKKTIIETPTQTDTPIENHNNEKQFETHTNVQTYIRTESEPNNAIQTDIQKATPTEKENAPLTESPKHNILSFNVAGVTFENDQGKDIQTLLRKIGKAIAREKDIPAYAGMTNSEILDSYTEVSEFEDVEFGEYIFFEKDPNNEYDKNAIKVMVKIGDKTHHIGHVPKKNNIQLNKLIESDLIIDISANFVGGKIKEVDYDFEKDKEIVVIKELTLGVEITVHYKNE
jgi:HIRAN domain